MTSCSVFCVLLCVSGLRYSWGQDDVVGCGGFIRSKYLTNFSRIKVQDQLWEGLYLGIPVDACTNIHDSLTFPMAPCKQVNLYTKSGAVKYSSECAPNNGYFLIPLYDKVSTDNSSV